MRNIAVVVEGQTEERFLTEVIQPYALKRDAWVTPVIVKTSRPAGRRAFRGGGGWPNYEHDIRGLLRAPNFDLVTTMIDFYGYPRDAPGKSVCSRPHMQPRCVEALETAMGDSLASDRFLPHVLLYEFETLVIAAASHAGRLLDDDAAAKPLRAAVDAVDGNVELVNDGPDTAPSKRVVAAMPDYIKAIDGVAAIEQVGLDAVLAACPRFSRWLERVVDH